MAHNALLQTIATNLDAEVEAGSDYDELRILRAIVTAESGTPTPVAGTYERITLLNDWATAKSADPPGEDDYAEIEQLRAIAAAYTAEDAGGSNYEVVRLLTAIGVATEPE